MASFMQADFLYDLMQLTLDQSNLDRAKMPSGISTSRGDTDILCKLA
jgi:hypothetical protein